jgi:hypothetical protein
VFCIGTRVISDAAYPGVDTKVQHSISPPPPSPASLAPSPPPSSFFEAGMPGFDPFRAAHLQSHIRTTKMSARIRHDRIQSIKLRALNNFLEDNMFSACKAIYVQQNTTDFMQRSFK